MTEQEELELLKQNSPMALPDDPSASGWSTDQIKRKFYTGLLVLYDFFKASRNSQNGNIQSMQEVVNEINLAYNEIMNQETILKVKFDMDGNEIVTTYAKLLDIANGTVAAVKYLAEDGTTKKYIYELESALTNLTSNFNLVKEWADNIKSATSTEAVQRAVQATKDSLGNVIKDTYATINSFNQIATNVVNIINGTTIVDKSYKDQNGNVIDNTYETKANVDIIKGKIPNEASSENQLADKSFVNSSIATATATYRGSYNLVSDLSLTTSASQSDIATALGTAINTADNNDYCYVRIPTATDTPTQISQVDRYKHNGTAWVYEYTLNNSGYTSTQWAAINSGITSALVTAIGLNTTARHTHDNKGLLDTYTQTENDLADAVSKKHSHSNKSVLDSITVQDISNISKALYHKGAFDSVSGNTITRQTGYVDLGSLSWTEVDTNCWRSSLANFPNIITSGGGKIIVGTNYQSASATDYAEFIALGVGYIGMLSTYDYIVCMSTGKPTGLAQYKLATSYTEEIIPNQPILNLDSNMANKIRQKVVDGLNLFTTSKFYNFNYTTTGAVTYTSNSITNNNAYAWDRCYFEYALKPNTTYIFGYISSNGGVAQNTQIQYPNNDGTAIEVYDTKVIFTTGSTGIVRITMYFALNDNPATAVTFSNIQLNTGSHAYPYSDFNQKEHITNDEATLLKEEEEKCRNLWGSFTRVLNMTANSNSGTYFSYNNEETLYIPLKAGTYTIKGSVGYATYSTSIPSVGVSYTKIGVIDNGQTFTCSTDVYLAISHSLNDTLSNIMLNEGSEAKPYQEYNGAIVHKADIEPVLLWENSSPTSNQSGGAITTKDASAYKYLVIGKKKTTAESGVQYEKIKYEATNFFLSVQEHAPSNIYSRALTISSGTSMTLSSGYKNGSVDDSACIITEIYGTNVL